MVILSEKDDGLVPPPPYFAIEAPDSAGHTLAHFRSESSMRLPMARQRRRRAPDLPSHVLLLIVYSTLPLEGEYRLDRATGVQRRESSEEMAIRTTRTLYWMAFCLRGVNRGFYLGKCDRWFFIISRANLIIDYILEFVCNDAMIRSINAFTSLDVPPALHAAGTCTVFE